MHVNLVVLLAVACSVHDSFPAKTEFSTETELADEGLLTRLAGYAPVTGKCPTPAPVIRQTTPIQELGADEKAYLAKREPKSRLAWKAFLENLAIPGVDVNSLTDSATPLPVVAWTASGGGYRAMINAGAHYWAKDARNPQASPLRGFVQLLTYHDGLSGGSWFLCSNIANNYPTVPGMIRNIWNLQENLVYPGGNTIQAAFTIRRWLDQVAQKKDAGFPVSLTDLWARALSLHILSGDIDSTNFRLTDIRNRYPVKDADIGFPLFEADNQFRNSSNTFTNQWEWNLFETGSYAPNISGFVPTEYIGTTFQNGQVADNGKCVTYFDNAMFAFGTSSSAFNVAINGSLFNETYSNTWIEPAQAAQVPNPFLNIPTVDANVKDAPTIGLADGGLDLQNVPLWTLLNPSRKVDVIYAIDSSCDTSAEQGGPCWANASSLIWSARYARAFNIPFPEIPMTATEFTDLGLTKRISFFGCWNDADKTAVAGARGSQPPILVLQPNRYVNGNSNTSTFLFVYTPEQIDTFMKNGYGQVMGQNSSLGDQTDFPWCMGCLMIARSDQYQGNALPAACQDCLNRYCWSPNNPDYGKAPSVNISANWKPKEDINWPSSAKRLHVALAAVLVLLLI